MRQRRGGDAYPHAREGVPGTPLSPYPEDLVIATKAGPLRDAADLHPTEVNLADLTG